MGELCTYNGHLPVGYFRIIPKTPSRSLLIPNNLTDAPRLCLDFYEEAYLTWDETRSVDGYPGRYVVLARRHGGYVVCKAAINAMNEVLNL